MITAEIFFYPFCSLITKAPIEGILEFVLSPFCYFSFGLNNEKLSSDSISGYLIHGGVSKYSLSLSFASQIT